MSELDEKTLAEWRKGIHEAWEDYDHLRIVIDALRAARQELAASEKELEIRTASQKVAYERIAELEQQLAQLRKWVNLGGPPSGKQCTWDANDIHEIHGPGYTLIGGIDICLIHEIKRLTEQSQRDRDRIADLEDLVVHLSEYIDGVK